MSFPQFQDLVLGKPYRFSMTNIVHKHESPERRTQRSLSLFSIPPPLKLLFDRVPLITYEANEQPSRSSNLLHGLDHKLFIWTSSKGAENDAASFNPSCLKWQVGSPSLLSTTYLQRLTFVEGLPALP
jgi:hypothetical protein